MKNKFGFSIIEIIVSILIISIVLVGGFQAYSAVSFSKIKLINNTDIEKEAFYFSEKLFEEIKKGGTLDYEEYWNRQIVGTGVTNGYYSSKTGFGNFGDGGNVGSTTYGNGFYFCRSQNAGNKVGTGGCLDSNLNNYSAVQNGKPQRYGQYALQFIDYNSNYDDDGGIYGDEDGDTKIIGDDDDEYLGDGPTSFSGTNNEIKELYLISGDKKTRTLFRWNIKDDPSITSPACDFTTGSGGCIATIEFLKLSGVDYGLAHTGTITDGSKFDGKVDTWNIHSDFTSNIDLVAGKDNSDNYRIPLFPDYINVKNFKIFAYPNKDIKLAWKDLTTNTNISPYIKLQMTLEATAKRKRGIKGKNPEIKISTTINLTDIYSR